MQRLKEQVFRYHDRKRSPEHSDISERSVEFIENNRERVGTFSTAIFLFLHLSFPHVMLVLSRPRKIQLHRRYCFFPRMCVSHRTNNLDRVTRFSVVLGTRRENSVAGVERFL